MNNIFTNVIKKQQYNLILERLQSGWNEYIEEKTQNEWLDDTDNNYDEYKWYNQCWNNWVNQSYEEHKQYYMSNIEKAIWYELLNEDIIKIKIILYIILILFGFYITNHTVF